MSDVNLHDTTDARVWAQEWLKTIAAHPKVPYDEGTMITWFSNAIMAGIDETTRRANQVKYEGDGTAACNPLKVD